MTSSLPIGVFDSGVGGLTVLKAIKNRLPHEDLLYLGDTARLPYGTKSKGTVSRYALQASAKLVEQGIKLLVIACNTATATAIDDLRAAWPKLPILGVIEPGAKVACASSKNKHIAVIATESTIKNQAYHKAIQKMTPDAKVTGQACSLFVALAEEGWVNGPEAEIIAKRYLAPIFNNTDQEKVEDTQTPDCLVLGCTHFPPFASMLANVVGPQVTIVDSAATTAEAVEEELKRLNIMRAFPDGERNTRTMRFMTTDDADRFARIGKLFLGDDISDADIELINL